MEWQQWVPAVLSLIGGGAAGASITALVANYRNRVQPVGFRAEPLPMFQGVADGRGVKLKVSLESDGKLYEFPNLHAIDVEIVNRGNSDKAAFGFGLTLSPPEEAVLVETIPGDRHHVFASLPKVSPTSPSGELDFEVRPFNRGDRYRFTAYVTLPQGKDSVGEITFSSPESVVFTPMPTAGDIGMKIARIAANQAFPFALGGIRIEFERKGPYIP